MAVTVSKLATQVGLSADAIRYYERVGLLPAAARSEAGYRLYGSGDAERLCFIKGARRLGLRLAEIRELLGVLDRGLCPCGHTEALLRTRIDQVEDELRRLADVRETLLRVTRRLPPEACAESDAGGWPCAEEFIREGR
ncbi:MAG: MerR family DNA-binding protein [Actinobacteria bacterium]|nr:MerR family DNA-binding protein [Actinomycetota bacterium]